MALNTLWISVICISHLTGLTLLLYSLEQTSGIITRLSRRYLRKGTIHATQFESRHWQVFTNNALGGTHYELRWDNISCWSGGPAPKQLLQACYGSARSGETTALLGPSGSGKSTLLGLLSGNQGRNRVEGDLTLNGQKVSKVAIRGNSALVTQLDKFIPSLSVLETLRFRASLTSTTEIEGVQPSLDSILRTTGLLHTKATKVGGLLPGGVEVKGLSGGEKRRLSIACALIGDPQVLFMDEPTSGLDSYSALKVMQHVFELAKKGKMIFVSIHQPRMEIFDRMSSVVLLSEGRQLYFGSPGSATQWFEQLGYVYKAGIVSVSDWLLDTVSVGFDKTRLDDTNPTTCMSTLHDIQQAADAFVNDFKHGSSTTDLEKGECVHEQQAEIRLRVRWHKQFRILLQRAFLAQIRNPTDTASRLLLATWIGLLTGLVFYNLPDTATSIRARLSVIFYILMVFQLLPFSFMSFFVADRNFFLADVKSNLYTPSAYFMAVSLASYPSVILNATSGSLMAYGLSGLRSDTTSVVLYVVFVCLQALVSQQLLIFCVWAASNQDMAYILSTGYVAFCMLLSGFFIRLKDVSITFVKALSWASFSKYTLMALARLELLGRNWTDTTCMRSVHNIGANNDDTSPLSEAELNECEATGDEQLSYYGYDVPVSVDGAAILSFWFFLAMCSFLALYVRARRQK